jgi:hypothetical protein
MTKREYAEFEANFAAFMEREGLANLSTVSEEEGCTEPYFSWRPCHCCGSHLGGDRYDCNGYNPTTKEVQDGYSVCQDCVYYAEYGVLDDMTMLEIERSEE